MHLYAHFCIQKCAYRCILVCSAHFNFCSAGSGRELRQLHDLVSRHLRSLRTIKGDTFDSFLSSLIKMKLDQGSKFAWQQHTYERKDVPSIEELLKFVVWRAQASELSCPRELSYPRDAERKYSTMEKKFKPRTSYQVNTERKCAAWNEASHPLYTCTAFQALSQEDRQAIVRKQGLCIKCLRHGNFANQCQSAQKCKKCGGTHHTLLHLDTGKAGREASSSKSITTVLSKKSSTERVTSNFSNGNRGSVLLMTCQGVIRGPNGSTTRARGLLDSGCEASFITERLAQQLRLSRRRGPMITCIGETTPHVRSRGLVDIEVTDAREIGKVHAVQALVLTKITSSTPACPVSEQRNWTHLTGLSLADPCRLWNSWICGFAFRGRYVQSCCSSWPAVRSHWSPFSLQDSIRLSIDRVCGTQQSPKELLFYTHRRGSTSQRRLAEEIL